MPPLMPRYSSNMAYEAEERARSKTPKGIDRRRHDCLFAQHCTYIVPTMYRYTVWYSNTKSGPSLPPAFLTVTLLAGGCSGNRSLLLDPRPLYYVQYSTVRNRDSSSNCARSGWKGRKPYCIPLRTYVVLLLHCTPLLNVSKGPCLHQRLLSQWSNGVLEHIQITFL